MLARMRHDRRSIRRLILLDLREQFRASFAVRSMLATLPTARRGELRRRTAGVEGSVYLGLRRAALRDAADDRSSGERESVPVLGALGDRSAVYTRPEGDAQGKRYGGARKPDPERVDARGRPQHIPGFS